MSEHAQRQVAQRTSSQGAKRERSAPIGENSKFKPSVAKARGAIAHNFSRRQSHHTNTVIQAKSSLLQVGRVNDPLEAEADAVAKDVVHNKSVKLAGAPTSPNIQPRPWINRISRQTISPQAVSKPVEVQKKQTVDDLEETGQPDLQRKPKGRLQAKCATCGGDHPDEPTIQRKQTGLIQTKCAACEEESIRRKENAAVFNYNQGFTTSQQTSDQISTQKSRGEAMPRSLRSEMEAGFGADFSGVKIHRGASSAKLNNDINAKAFTTGQHIFFGAGQYDDQSKKGKELIAHELTHTIQQGAVSNKVQRVAGYQQEKTLYIQDPLGLEEVDQNSLANPLTEMQKVGLHKQSSSRKDPCPGLKKDPVPLAKILELSENYSTTLLPPTERSSYDFSSKFSPNQMQGQTEIGLNPKVLPGKRIFHSKSKYYRPKLQDAPNLSQAKKLMGIGDKSILNQTKQNQNVVDRWRSQIDSEIQCEIGSAGKTKRDIQASFGAAREELISSANLFYDNSAASANYYHGLMAENEAFYLDKIGTATLGLEDMLINGEFNYRKELIKDSVRLATWAFQWFDHLIAKVEGERACALESIDQDKKEEIVVSQAKMVNHISDEAIKDFTNSPYEIGYAICKDADQYRDVFTNDLSEVQAEIQMQLDSYGEMLPASRLGLVQSMEYTLATIDAEMVGLFGEMLARLNDAEADALGKASDITNQSIADLEGLFGLVYDGVARENLRQVSESTGAVNQALYQLEVEGSEDPIRAFADQAGMEKNLVAHLRVISSNSEPVDKEIVAAFNKWMGIHSNAMRELCEISKNSKESLIVELEKMVETGTGRIETGFYESYIAFDAQMSESVEMALSMLSFLGAEYGKGFEKMDREVGYQIMDYLIQPHIKAEKFVERLPAIFASRFKEIERISNMTKSEAFWEAVGNFFSDVGNILMIVGIVTLLAILAEISGPLAAFVGIAMFVVFTAMAVISRFVAMAEDGVTGRELAFFFGVYLGKGIFLLDGLGLAVIVEGIVEMDLSTGRALNKVEAGTRLGEGFSNLVVLVATIGIAKGKAWLDVRTSPNGTFSFRAIASEGKPGARGRSAVTDPAMIGEGNRGWSKGKVFEPGPFSNEGNLRGPKRMGGKDPFIPERALEPFTESTKELPDGHHQKTMKDGRCFICSPICVEVTELIKKYPHLVEEPHFKARLAEIGELSNSGQKARALELKTIVDGELSIANSSSRLVHYEGYGTWLERVPRETELGKSYYSVLDIEVAGLKIQTEIKGKVVTENNHPDARITDTHFGEMNPRMARNHYELEGAKLGEAISKQEAKIKGLKENGKSTLVEDLKLTELLAEKQRNKLLLESAIKRENGTQAFGKTAEGKNSRLAELKQKEQFYKEQKRKNGMLSKQEKIARDKLQREIENYGNIGSDSPFGRAYEPARLRNVGEKVAAEEIGYLMEAQEYMNDLNKKGANFGDHSVAWSIIGEQVQGGYEPGLLKDLTRLHKKKGAESIQRLISMAKYFENKPGLYDVSQRLMTEAIKTNEALIWANEYAATCREGWKAPLPDRFPDWVISDPKYLESLKEIHLEKPRYPNK